MTPTPQAACPDALLPAPQELESPQIDQYPQATWAFFGWSFPAACSPESFRLQIARDPSFTELEAEGQFEAVGHEGDQYSLQFVNTGFQLDPGRYYWRIAAVSAEGQGPYSARQLLIVGPDCIQGGYGEFVAPWPQAPIAVWPPDGGTLYSNITSDRYLAWDYIQCTISDDIHSRTSEVQLADNQKLEGAIGSSIVTVNEYQIPIRLEDCRIYYWRVRLFMDMTPPEDVVPPGMGASDPFTGSFTPGPTPIVGWSDFSQIFTFRTNFSGTCDMAQEQILEPPVAGNGEYEPIVVTTGKNMNCREGPDSRFPIVAIFTTAEQALLVGRLESLSWLYLHLPDGRMCWIFSEDLQVEGDSNLAPVLTPAPPPLDTHPGETSSPVCHPAMEQVSCISSGGQWITAVGASPHCECP